MKKITSIILILILLLSACGQASDENLELIKLSDKKGGNEDFNSSSDVMGRYIQTDITPPDIKNIEVINISQGENEEYLLSVYDNDKQMARAFSYQVGTWTEKNNEDIIRFLADKNVTDIKPFYDFSDNWWVFYIEDTLTKGFQITQDGIFHEIKLPDYTDSVGINNCLISNTNTIALDISYMGRSKKDIVVIDVKTGIVIEDKIPSSKSSISFQMIGNELLVEDNNEIISYDILSGEVVDSYKIADSLSPIMRGFTTSQEGNIFAVDNSGIHTIDKTGQITETVINDKSYAFADSSIKASDAILLTNKNMDKFMLLLKSYGDFKIFEYHLDENIPTNKSEVLNIWSFENGRDNNRFLRKAVSIFAQKFPDCEIILEYGMDTTTLFPTTEEVTQMQADAIQALNVKLIAGNVPDILFLDGLSIETLYNKGFLSDINLELDETQYYEKILKSYMKDDKTYAYPASFSMPILASDGTLPDIEQKNTLSSIAELYQNPKNIEGHSNSWLLFSTFFYSEYDKIFPDYQTINENALNEFLIQTKKIADLNGSLYFQNGETSSIAMVSDNMSWAPNLFLSHEKVEIIPLFEGTFIAQNIASIPKGASNKEMAEKFIQTILSEQAQEMQLEYFSVMKEVQFEYLKKTMKENTNTESSKEFKNIANQTTDFLAFDWDDLINKYTNSVETDFLMEGIIYEQALKLYDDQISIETALSECMNKISIIIAERN